jgi:hypothetical protein
MEGGSYLVSFPISDGSLGSNLLQREQHPQMLLRSLVALAKALCLHGTDVA